MFSEKYLQKANSLQKFFDYLKNSEIYILLLCNKKLLKPLLNVLILKFL
jgi:hypothetical protein